MMGSAVVYLGLALAFAGVAFLVKPVRLLRVRTRRRGLAIAAVGVLLAGTGLLLPAPESRVGRAETRLDEFAPVWQFSEHHTIRIAAPPARVYDAILRVRADEIALFSTLTWIRRGGQPLPEGILNAGATASLIDVATRNGFARLADEAPRELVIGTVVVAPPGTRGALTSDVFQRTLPTGFALATMNFLVKPDGDAGSIVSTETRVFANGPSARRRFAGYWRLIYPGSAIIRRMWLRAIERRATSPVSAGWVDLPTLRRSARFVQLLPHVTTSVRNTSVSAEQRRAPMRPVMQFAGPKMRSSSKMARVFDRRQNRTLAPVFRRRLALHPRQSGGRS